MVTKDYIVFCSPGTFVHETSMKEIDSWDVRKAVEMANGITERYGSKPFGFYFQTKGRDEHEMDSKVIDSSKMYYLGGKVESFAEVCERNDPNERILRSNMEGNHWEYIITNTNSYKITQPLRKGDVVLSIIDGALISQTEY